MDGRVMRRLLILAIIAISFSPLLFARVEWSSAATDSIIGKPVIFTDKAIFASYDGRVYAYSLKNGAITWTLDTGKFIAQGAVLVGKDKVGVAGMDGTVFIISAAEGKALYEVPTGKKPTALSSADNRIYAGYDGGVVGISAAGRVIWTFAANASVGQIGSGNGRLYFTASQRLFSLAGTSGAARWQANAEDSFLSRPFETDGKVYFGSTDGRVYGFDAASGNLDWTFKTGGWVMSTPLLVGNALFFGSNDGYAYSTTKYGQLRFRVPISGEVWAQPVSYDQNGRTVVVFPTTDNKLYGIDSQTGKKEWVFQSYGRPEEIALAEKNLVFGTNKGKAYFISTSEICGFTWPADMQVTGEWPLELEGKASAEGDVSRVEVRIADGQWVAANGKDDWYATLDLSGSELGAVSVQCRAIGQNGLEPETEYSALTVIKSKSAVPAKMYVAAPGEADPAQNITVSVQDIRGADLRNLSLTVDGKQLAMDSPFAVVLGRSGPVSITIKKPGFEAVNLVVIGKGGSGDTLTLIILGAAMAGVVAYLLVGRKMLGKKGDGKKT